jgi:hypothetical protein
LTVVLNSGAIVFAMVEYCSAQLSDGRFHALQALSCPDRVSAACSEDQRFQNGGIERES